MTQYGLKTHSGVWLPRDAGRRGNGERFLHPDLWQDQDRAKVLAEKYQCTVVTFNVSEVK